jgi:hypothetical protein
MKNDTDRSEDLSHRTNLAEAWIHYQVSKDSTSVWSLDAMSRLIHIDIDEAWATIVTMCRLADSPEVLCAVGSGPIEDLFRLDGERSANVLEALIPTNPRLIVAVACVWAKDSPERHRIDLLLQEHEQRRL